MANARKKLKPVDSDLSFAQRSKPCIITGCDIGGRTIGRLGDIELNYCGKHRKYGERVLNFLIRSVFGEKLKELLKESKDDLFMEHNPELCTECNKKLAVYVSSMVTKLDEAQKWKNKMK
jgi:hypothetical protein